MKLFRLLVLALAVASLFSCRKDEIKPIIETTIQEDIQGDWTAYDLEWREDKNSPWEFLQNHTEHPFNITETHMGGSPYIYTECTETFNVIDEEDGQPDKIVNVHSFNGVDSLILYYIVPNGQNIKYYLKK